MNTELYYTMKEISELAGVTRQRVNQYITRGQLKALFVFGKPVVRKVLVHEFLANRRKPGRPKNSEKIS